ncbi:MAG: alpha-N-arabinofuranosidase [Bryobacteraceae bacterium]
MSNSTLSRRQFSALGLGAPFLLKGRQVSSQAAHITVNPNRVIGQIDPKLYGNFLEHLGRCIEGGVFDEGSPLSDSEGFRRDVLKAVEGLHVPLLRWPGGNFSSNYNWRDGVGPRDSRSRRLEMAWGTIEDNRFGTHEFLDYIARIGAEPYICANLGTGTWDEAQQWVEYVNFDGDTTTTRLRKKNGREKPWKVTYWGLGNEMDGPWQMGHRTADDYGKFALEAAKLMHWTDPSIKLVAAGSSNFNPGIDWVGWNRTVLNYLKEHVDYLSLHMYVGNPENDYYEFQASTVDLANRIKITEGVIRDALWDAPRNKKIHIAWDEWNVWYRARGDKERGRRILEEHYNLEDALVVSSFLNTFVNHAHIVKIANMAQLVNVIAPIFTNKEGLFLQTIYYPLQLFATNCHGNALDLLVESPTYTSKKVGEVPYFDVSAAYDSNGSIVLNVTNRDRDHPLDAVFELQNKRFNGEFQTFEVNGPDIKAENNFNSTLVKTTQKSVAANDTTLKYTFPAHSFTMLKGRLT